MIRNILLIDDNEIDNFITEKLLRNHHTAENITVTTSADDAINYLDELEKYHMAFPEIIFLDLNMPLMDGFSFLELFRTYPRDLIDRTCILILSSSSDPKDMHRAKRYRHVKGYFVKPLPTNKLKWIENCYKDVISLAERNL
jgi:CheY-like chemotaxis protein